DRPRPAPRRRGDRAARPRRHDAPPGREPGGRPRRGLRDARRPRCPAHDLRWRLAGPSPAGALLPERVRDGPATSVRAGRTLRRLAGADAALPLRTAGRGRRDRPRAARAGTRPDAPAARRHAAPARLTRPGVHPGQADEGASRARQSRDPRLHRAPRDHRRGRHRLRGRRPGDDRAHGRADPRRARADAAGDPDGRGPRRGHAARGRPHRQPQPAGVGALTRPGQRARRAARPDPPQPVGRHAHPAPAGGGGASPEGTGQDDLPDRLPDLPGAADGPARTGRVPDHRGLQQV
ncbi:MAG: hypothetical protein AVDCRST_MAG79-1869, partial [uncultured Thermoleophilia bacterium]